MKSYLKEVFELVRDLFIVFYLGVCALCPFMCDKQTKLYPLLLLIPVPFIIIYIKRRYENEK